eukprot:CAMPEP_0170557768 /NCGR_PEP_ID=MMETSP0211-20121228/29975_1 /TAXON_ID=311385 /ORGANISM="Pseudokeronopsis sp., Strain OXSARD2" /LENGTH=123 /DNA_ID=CAMNT_0010869087 /DNA_START=106 /DNA_END=474 /DNA_ORIENTATION=+
MHRLGVTIPHEQSPHTVHKSEAYSGPRVEDASEKDEEEHDSDLFIEVLVHPLAQVEEEPVLIFQLSGVISTSCVGISLFGRSCVIGEGFSVDLLEVGLHELFIEDLPSLEAHSDEASHEALET